MYEGKKGVWEGGERCNVAGIVWKKGWVKGRERERKGLCVSEKET